MNELLGKLLHVNEDAAGVNALYRVYHDVERDIDPSPEDVFTALHMMQEYYVDYLHWYDKGPVKTRREDKMIIEDYRKRLREVTAAMGGRDLGGMLVALDTAINQWHRDYPVIAHLNMDQEDEELESVVDKVAEILIKLGRLSKSSPYQEGGRRHSR